MDIETLSPEDAGFARGLALEAIEKNRGGLIVSAILDIAYPDTIHNFNTFGCMLLDAYRKGVAAAELKQAALEADREHDESERT